MAAQNELQLELGPRSQLSRMDKDPQSRVGAGPNVLIALFVWCITQNCATHQKTNQQSVFITEYEIVKIVFLLCSSDQHSARSLRTSVAENFKEVEICHHVVPIGSNSGTKEQM